MRRFLSGHAPDFNRILFVESGSRHLVEHVITLLKTHVGQHVEMGLVTCFAGVPQNFRGEVFRIGEYSGSAGRKRLYKELRERKFPITCIICSGEPIMMKWKWALVANVPAKILVLNENGDFFWLDRPRWRIAAHFVLYRAGVTGSAAIPAVARLLFFPVTLAYLLLYASFVHLRRKLRTL